MNRALCICWTWAAVVSVVSSAALVAACGSSSSSRAEPNSPAPTSHDVVGASGAVRHAASGTGGHAVNDDNAGTADGGASAAADQIRPCSLISKAEAQAVIGKPIASVQEAPLGPTCIYQPRGTSALVTIALETADLAATRRSLHHPTLSEVAGHAVFCGGAGPPISYTQISGGRVLDTAAPCRIGAKLSALALGRLDT
jgi:hypothetical protein